MISSRVNLLHSTLGASLLAAAAHLVDLKLRADADVPGVVRTIEFLAGASGVMLGTAGIVSEDGRMRAKLLAALLATWCLYCALFASAFPRVIR